MHNREPPLLRTPSTLYSQPPLPYSEPPLLRTPGPPLLRTPGPPLLRTTSTLYSGLPLLRTPLHPLLRTPSTQDPRNVTTPLHSEKSQSLSHTIFYHRLVVSVCLVFGRKLTVQFLALRQCPAYYWQVKQAHMHQGQVRKTRGTQCASIKRNACTKPELLLNCCMENGWSE